MNILPLEHAKATTCPRPLQERKSFKAVLELIAKFQLRENKSRITYAGCNQIPGINNESSLRTVTQSPISNRGKKSSHLPGSLSRSLSRKSPPTQQRPHLSLGSIHLRASLFIVSSHWHWQLIILACIQRPYLSFSVWPNNLTVLGFMKLDQAFSLWKESFGSDENSNISEIQNSLVICPNG